MSQLTGFRAIFRWQVKPGRFDEFAAAWGQATQIIRETRAGALGSELCRLDDEPDVAIAIAHWQSRSQWQDSESLLESHPVIAERMLALAEVVRFESCSVIDSRVG